MKRIALITLSMIIMLITSTGCEQPVNILIKQEPFEEPEINNGPEYVKAYNGVTVYANNIELRGVPDDEIIIPQVRNPSVFDIYKTCTAAENVQWVLLPYA